MIESRVKLQETERSKYGVGDNGYKPWWFANFNNNTLTIKEVNNSTRRNISLTSTLKYY